MPACRYAFTVFTPTFNRAHTLERAYRSLLSQTFRDFEWLVIDDGSTDKTRALIEGWQSQANFSIRYFHQENQGKHIATNHGVREAHGELFLTLDSDDACTPTALERFKHHWDAIPLDRRPFFSAVSALCEGENGAIHGNRFPQDVIDSNSIEIRYRYRVEGEKWGFHRTDVLRQFPFPEIQGESFITEAYIWRAIARVYQTRYVNESLRIYFNDDTHQAGRLSKVVVGQQAKGRTLYCQSVLNHDLSWFRVVPLEYFRVAGNYVRYALHAGNGVAEQMKGLLNMPARLLWAFMFPVGCLLYLRDLTK